MMAEKDNPWVVRLGADLYPREAEIIILGSGNFPNINSTRKGWSVILSKKETDWVKPRRREC